MAGIAWTLHPSLFYEKYGSALVQLWDSGTLRNLFAPIRRLSAAIGAAVATGVVPRQPGPEDVAERTSSALRLSADTSPTEDAASSRANREPFESSAEPSTSQCNELAFQGDLYTIRRRQRKQKERLRRLREARLRADAARPTKLHRRRSILSDKTKKRAAYGRLKTIGTPLVDLHGALPRHRSVTMGTSDSSKSSLDVEEDEERSRESFAETVITDDDSLRRLKLMRGKRRSIGTPPTGRGSTESSEAASLDREGEAGEAPVGAATVETEALSEPGSKDSGAALTAALERDERQEGATGRVSPDVSHRPAPAETALDYPSDSYDLILSKPERKPDKSSEGVASPGKEVESRLEVAADAGSKLEPVSLVSGTSRSERREGLRSAVSAEEPVPAEPVRDLAIAEAAPNMSDDRAYRHKKKGDGAKTAKRAKPPENSQAPLEPEPGSSYSPQLTLGADAFTELNHRGVGPTHSAEGGGTSTEPGPNAVDGARRKISRRRPRVPGSPEVVASRELEGSGVVSKGLLQAMQRIDSPKSKQKHRRQHRVPHQTEVGATPTEPGPQAGREDSPQLMPRVDAPKHKKKGSRSVKPSAVHQISAGLGHGPDTASCGSPQAKSGSVGPKLSDTDEGVVSPGSIDVALGTDLRPDVDSRESPGVVQSIAAPKRKKRSRKRVQKVDSLDAGAASVSREPSPDSDPSRLAASLKPEGDEQATKYCASSKNASSPDVVNMLLEIRYPVFKKSSDDGDELSTGDQPMLNDPRLVRDLWPSWAAFDVDDQAVQRRRKACSPQEEDRLRQRLDNWDPSQEESYALVSPDQLESAKQETPDTTTWHGASSSSDDLSSERGTPSRVIRPKMVSPRRMARDRRTYQGSDLLSDRNGGSLITSPAQRFPSEMGQRDKLRGSASETVEVQSAESLSSSPLRSGAKVASTEFKAQSPLSPVKQHPKLVGTSPALLAADIGLSSESTSSECSFDKFIPSDRRERVDWPTAPGSETSGLASPPCSVESRAKATTPEATAETAPDFVGLTPTDKQFNRGEKKRVKGPKTRTKKQELRKREPPHPHRDRDTDDEVAPQRVRNVQSSQLARSPEEDVNERTDVPQSLDDLASAWEPLIFGGPDRVATSSSGAVSIRIDMTTRKRRSMLWPFGRRPPA